MQFNTKQTTILALLVIGIILRFLLMGNQAFKIDISTYQAWAGKLAAENPTTFYTPGYFADYFPGYLYLLWMMGEGFTFFAPNLGTGSSGFEFLIKVVTTFFDLGTAFIIYLVIKKYHKPFAVWGALAYIYNPGVIFNSSVWGQTDGVMTFFVTLSLYLLLETKRYWFWVFSVAFSVLIKPQSLAVFPIMFGAALTCLPTPRVLLAIALIPLIILGAAFPFFLSDPIFGLIKLSQESTKVYPFTSLYAFNFWSLLGFWKSDMGIFLGLNYQVWGIIIFLICLGLILLKLVLTFKKSSSMDHYLIYYAAALSFFAFFMFLTRMHERYLFPFFALFTITVFLRKNFLLLGLLIAMSFIQLLNLWYVYFYYNIVFNNPNFPPNILYDTLLRGSGILSIASLTIFGMIALIYFTSKKTHENHN